MDKSKFLAKHLCGAPGITEALYEHFKESGDLENLLTTDKSSLVSAINEAYEHAEEGGGYNSNYLRRFKNTSW